MVPMEIGRKNVDFFIYDGVNNIGLETRKQAFEIYR
jgi:hypothetical protein